MLSRATFSLAFYVILAVLAVSPLLTTTMPPLVDYPNHLARAYILNMYDETPALQSNYLTNVHLSTNMAMTLLVSAMAKVIDIYDAGRVFIALSIGLVIVGTLSLRKAVNNKIDVWLIFTFLVIYNHSLFWGFLNFYFGSGLFLLAFAAWIWMREWHPIPRSGLFTLIPILLFVCHVFALGMYALSVFGYELWRSRQYPVVDRVSSLRNWGLTLGQFLPTLILMIGWTSNFADSQGGQETSWSASHKLLSIFSPVLLNGKLIDLVTATVVFLILIWCLRSKHVSFVPALRWPLILLTVAALLMPTKLFGVWGTDIRIPPFAVLLLVAGLRFEKANWRTMCALASVTLALFVWRLGDVSHEWHVRDKKTHEFREALQQVRQGARVLLILDHLDAPKNDAMFGPQSYWHIGALGVIERSAFLPTIFTGHTLISAAPAIESIDTPVLAPLSREILRRSTGDAYKGLRLGDHVNRFFRAFWVGWPKQFDYLIIIRFDNRANPVPKSLRPVVQGSFFDIYRIIPGFTPTAR